MSFQDNIEVVRRLTEARTNRDWDAFGDLVAEHRELRDGTNVRYRDHFDRACPA